MYCGAALGAEQVAAAEKSAALAQGTPPPPSERVLVVLNAAGVTRDALAHGLRVSTFEAEQRRRRGGYQLQRVADAQGARDEAARLQAAGLEAFLVPEEEARAALTPWVALGGRWEDDGLRLRLEGAPACTVAPGALLIVVQGPIARALEPSEKHKRLRLAGPAEGQRLHLHFREESRPVEIDPDSFDFGRTPVAGSSALEIAGWLSTLAAPMDDSFRHLTPALGPAQASTGVASALAPLRSGRARPAAQFDNLAQFRFHSGWRAAVERRARG